MPKTEPKHNTGCNKLDLLIHVRGNGETVAGDNVFQKSAKTRDLRIKTTVHHPYLAVEQGSLNLLPAGLNRPRLIESSVRRRTQTVSLTNYRRYAKPSRRIVRNYRRPLVRSRCFYPISSRAPLLRPPTAKLTSTPLFGSPSGAQG
jgi:hypothetical protein